MQPEDQIILPPLLDCARDTERHVAAAGWDQPPRLFALVPTAELMEAEPALAAQLGAEVPGGYTAIEQDELPSTQVEELLASIAWPPHIHGVALAVERIVLPPHAEATMPAEPEAASSYAAEHPERQDVRLLAAVLRDGERVCLLRQRQHDHDDDVAMGDDIAPGLLDALSATLDDA